MKNAKAGHKTTRLYDEKGLYLEISPKGGKWWGFNYRFNGKEKRLSLGVCPDEGHKSTRDKRDKARRLVADQNTTLSRLLRRSQVQQLRSFVTIELRSVTLEAYSP